MTYRILVTGSREWTDKATIRHALFATWRAAGVPEDVVLVSGHARGADAIAEVMGDGFGFTVERHPADWEHKHQAAGPIRNTEMVKLGADVCLAFLMPDSKGTKDCMAKARKAGIDVIVITPGDL